MAQYSVTFGCGHKGIVNLIGKHSERECKLKYYEEYGMCSDCYRKQKEKEREDAEVRAIQRVLNNNMKLFVYAEFLPYTDDDEIKVFIYVDGLSYETDLIKDNVNGIQDKYTAAGFLYQNPEGRVKDDKKCWGKVVSQGEISETLHLLGNCGCCEFLDIDYCKRAEEAIFTELNIKERAEKLHESYLKHMKRLGKWKSEVPEQPDILAGKYWNGTIYGKAQKSIYLDNIKTVITDEDAEMIEEWKKARSKYLEVREVVKNELRTIGIVGVCSSDLRRRVK